jgi:hypothetical protein
MRIVQPRRRVSAARPHSSSTNPEETPVTTTTAPADPLADLPAEVRAELDERLAEYRRRTDHLRAVVLPNGGIVPEMTFVSAVGESYRPSAIAFLRLANDWWHEAVALAGRIAEIGRSVDDDQRAALHTLVRDELAQAVRARGHILAAYAVVMIDDRAAAPLGIGEHGEVIVGGVRYELGAAVAGPPPRRPEIKVVDFGATADPEALAERLRAIAAEVDATGAAPANVHLEGLTPRTTEVVVVIDPGDAPALVAAELRRMAAGMAEGAQ